MLRKVRSRVPTDVKMRSIHHLKWHPMDAGQITGWAAKAGVTFQPYLQNSPPRKQLCFQHEQELMLLLIGSLGLLGLAAQREQNCLQGGPKQGRGGSSLCISGLLAAQPAEAE